MAKGTSLPVRPTGAIEARLPSLRVFRVKGNGVAGIAWRRWRVRGDRQLGGRLRRFRVREQRATRGRDQVTGG